MRARRHGHERGLVLPGWYPRAASAVAAMASLQPNWDGHGAKRIDPAAVQTALAILSRAAVDIDEPYIVPTPGGGVQLEWHPQGVDLELEARADGKVGFLAIDQPSNREQEGELPTEAPEIAAMLSALAHRSSPLP